MAVAVVDANGNVTNMIVADDQLDQPPLGSTLVKIPAGQDVDELWTYKSGAFIPPDYYATVDTLTNTVQKVQRLRSGSPAPASTPSSKQVAFPHGTNVDVGYTWTQATGFVAPIRPINVIV